MKEALYYRQVKNDVVVCELCPKFCRIKPGGVGNCLVRTNIDGKLYSEIYGKVSATNIDPIEKKPLYHFYPGKKVFSMGNVGCNFHCQFCQNHTISQCAAKDSFGLQDMSVEDIINKIYNLNNNIGVAYTYNEPFINFEYNLELSKAVHNNNLQNIMVSNGFVNEKPLLEILPYIDAFNIDLKAFNNTFYGKYVQGDIKPVLKTLEIIAKSKSHLEITFLLIQNINDDISEFKAMLDWIAKNLGKSVPLHITRYFPNYKMDIEPTPEYILNEFYRLAKKKLNHVFLGNIISYNKENTYCEQCGYENIIRKKYQIKVTGLNDDGSCFNCGHTGIIAI